jgi:hypothetical protein
MNLKVRTDDGRTHQVEAPSDMPANEFLKELILGIFPADGNLQAKDWSLVDQDTGQALQLEKTLNENGEREGQVLLLSLRRTEAAICPHCGFGNAAGGKFCGRCGKRLVPPPSQRVIKLYVHFQDGSSRSVKAPDAMRAGDLIAELLSTGNLTVENAKREAANWLLDDKDIAKTLDQEISLAANGVQGEHHLYLRRMSIKLYVHLKDGSTHQVEVREDQRTEAFIAEFLSTGNRTVKKREAANWILDDKDTARTLDHEKSLAANGVQDGHHLYLRRRVPSPHPLPHWLKIALGSAVVLAVLAALVIIGHFAIPPPIAVALNPGVVSLLGKQRQEFKATLTNARNQAVQWSLIPEIGSISQDGVYTAPPLILTEQTVTVTARSQQDPTKFASAVVTLKRSTGTVVHVNPPNKSLAASDTAPFAAQVSGSPNTDVKWTIDPEVGSISQDGIYEAPASVPAELSVKVTASSVAYPSASDSATVTLKPVRISLRPPPRMPVVSGPPLLFSATVSGSSDHSVRWSTSGPGSISKEGVYLPPPSVTMEQTVRITATGIADSTKSATTSFILKPIVSVSLNLTSVTLEANQQQQFSVTVIGSNNGAVHWSISGPGNMAASGLYAAPPLIPQQVAARVTATSQADPTKSASATITLRPISVSLTPASTQLMASQTTRFFAAVSGTSSARVEWSVTGRGNISQLGVYAAPVSIPAEQTAKVTATSSADPTKFATALVYLKPYTGPSTGVLILSGPLERNTRVVIENNRIVNSPGPSLSHPLSLSGDLLPGVPVQINVGTKGVAVEVAPGPSNGWKNIVLRSTNAKPSIRITWTVQ